MVVLVVVVVVAVLVCADLFLLWCLYCLVPCEVVFAETDGCTETCLGPLGGAPLAGFEPSDLSAPTGKLSAETPPLQSRRCSHAEHAWWVG